eukprot:m.26449 g.26449  ORF g.26449 m.26449 type:complete len:505 (+) comp6310_c0_seq1:74-1588(+)
MGAKKRATGSARRAPSPVAVDSSQHSRFGFLSGALVGAAAVLACLKAPQLWTPVSSNRGGTASIPNQPTHSETDSVRDAARLTTLLKENAQIRRKNPTGARDQLRMLLASSPLVPPQSEARRKAFDQLAETYSHLRNHSLAYAAHLQSHTIVEGWARNEHARTGAVNRRLMNELIISQVQLSTDLYLVGQYERALELTGKALQLQPPDAAKRVLLKLESTIFECKGDFVTALQRLEEALSREEAFDADESKKHLELLRRVSADPEVPSQIQTMMAAEQKRLIEALITRAGFESEHQLPRHYHRGLTALPWHNVKNTPDPSVPKAAALLRQEHPRLVAEFAALNRTGMLLREQECIHDPTGGRWRRYEATGAWRPLDPSTGCSTDTPVACDVLQQLRALGLRVIRAGYSAVEPGAWLKPHYGMSNGQLKMHLGLVVPSAKGRPCAALRVLNESRAWVEGDVLYFDDSFVHEVRNRCQGERVVFQVVFVHFDLQGEASARTVFGPK